MPALGATPLAGKALGQARPQRISPLPESRIGFLAHRPDHDLYML